MKTKIVYVLIFDDNTIYYEQALVSVWSLKYHNDCHVTLVTDKESRQLMLSGWREQNVGLFDEILPFHFEENVSKMERSRQLKTTLRSLISGDFLFIDTDTVITGDLTDIDNLTCDIGLVEHMNCAFDRNPHYQDILKRNERIWGKRERNLLFYYNSGVIFAKDNKRVHDFYKLWHHKWECSKDKGIFLDQPALYETCLDCQGVVSSISGIYNCQAVINVSYIAGAKVMHFFNTKDKKNSISPFIDGTIYREIKEEKGLSEKTRNRILHCKESFVSPIMLASGDDIMAWHSRTFDLLKYIVGHHKKTAFILNIIANKLLVWLGKE